MIFGGSKAGQNDGHTGVVCLTEQDALADSVIADGLIDNSRFAVEQPKRFRSTGNP